jgi:hypothetical protein
MIRYLAILVAVILLAATHASAQTVEAQRFRLAVGPCVLSSGSGAPSAGVTCDTYVDNATGDVWMKQAAVWKRIVNVTTGTTGALSKWAGATTLGDSAISESGGVATVNEAIGGPSYASQVSGWRITAAGAADVRYLFTNELRANIFTADAESVLAGAQRVTKSYSTISQAFTCPAAGIAATLWVNDAATYGDAPVFQTNDWIVIHALTRSALGPFNITECVGAMTAYADGSGANAGQQSWTFTRGSGANAGAMVGGTVVAVNQLAQDLGVSGNGYVETTALDGANNSNAPYMQVVTWTGAPTSANLTTRCRYGNVAGITGLASEYGLMCGDLTGPGHYLRLSNLVAELRDIPVNLLDASSNKVIALDPTGPSFAMGNPIPTTYTGGNAGLWMGNDGGTYKLRIGGAAGNRVQWDGATLSVSGEGSGVTNIDGSHIQANSITVGQLNATGFGDNLIKNGTFEGPPAQALAGWGVEASGLGGIQQGCCGTRGPGFMQVTSPGASGVSAGAYLAAPISGGQTYRVAFDLFGSGSAPNSLFIGINEYTASTAAAVRYVYNFSAAAPDVVSSSTTWFLYNQPITNGWTHYEFVYTVPASVNWGSIYFLNESGVNFFIDGVEMQLQIGPGNIKANSITANNIAAGTITGAKIAGGTITGSNIAGTTITAGNLVSGTITTTQIAASTITGGNIAAGTLTAGNIAGGTITSGQIAGGTITGGNIASTTITGGNIATGTITAGNIAAGTITADKLNVGTLSAISANLGSVTAGSLSAVNISGSTISGTNISGGTVTAGCATMNSNGITLTAGGGACNFYKWSSGNGALRSDGGSWTYLQSPDVQILSTSSNNYLNITDSDVTLAAPGSNVHLVSSSGNFDLQGNYLHFSPWSGSPGGGYAYALCVDSSGNIRRGEIISSSGGYCTVF